MTEEFEGMLVEDGHVRDYTTWLLAVIRNEIYDARTKKYTDLGL
jgi:hypothetical protein